MSPQGPCFEADANGCFSFHPEFASPRVLSVLGVFSSWTEKSVVYDQEGRKWLAKDIEAPFKKSWWRVLLANTVYNPWIPVAVHWHAPQPFSLAELRKAYLNAVDQDDDILTQFVEADELKLRIAQVGSFAELVEVHHWMETDSSNEGDDDE